MSILLPNGQDWLVSNWVSRGFFQDSIPFLQEVPLLSADIEFCYEAEIDTLDLRNAERETIEELKVLTTILIQDNELKHGENFHDKELFPIYLAKLRELQRAVDDVLVRIEDVEE